MRTSLTVLIVVAALGLIAGVSRADTISTFNASGTFQSGSTLSGTVTIDTTTGVVTAVDLTASSPDSLNFTFIQVQIPNSTDNGDFFLQTAPAAVGLPNLDFALPDSFLVGYVGGSIGSLDQPANGYVSDVFYQFTPQVTDDLVSGNLTATPLPSSAWMGLGLLGVLFAGSSLIRRRSTAA